MYSKPRLWRYANAAKVGILAMALYV